jgi:hypothetical protein
MPDLKAVGGETAQAGVVTPVGTPEKKRRLPTKSIPTDRLTVPKQLDLLRAWAAASGADSKAVTNRDVAAIVKMAETTTSLANAFFSAMGFLQKATSGFVPAPEVVNYNRAYNWNPQTAAFKLSPIIKNAWFAQALLPTLGFRDLPEPEAIDLLADASAAEPEYRKQLRLLLEYMDATGVITRDGGVVRLAKSTSASNSPEQEKESPADATASQQQAPAPQQRAAVSTMFSAAPEGVVQFNISIRVDMGELATWKPDRITAFFAGMAQVLAAKASVERDTAAS